LKRLKQIWRFTILLFLGATVSQADTLELKNGSFIKGRFVGGTEKEYDASDRGKIRKIRIETVKLNFDLAQNRAIIVQQLQTILRLSSPTDSAPN
jgi:hypothetical protein